ncbi:MAG TPA: SAM-dependent methyltransferase, partial [Rhodoferax sp.]|nr:SAM-dependent methyltransferase [Rhodoferax sp.]
MNTATSVAPRYALPQHAPASARAGLRLLDNLRHGALTLVLPDGSHRRYGEHPHQHAQPSPHHPSATLK